MEMPYTVYSDFWWGNLRITGGRYIFYHLDIFLKVTVYMQISIQLMNIIKRNINKYNVTTQVLYKGIFNEVIHNL